MKNYQIILLSLIMCYVFIALPAPSYCADTILPFEEIKTVGALNSTVLQSEFGWDETPYLYLKLPENTERTGTFKDWNFTKADWTDPGGAIFNTLSSTFTQREHWLTIDNWDDVKAVGEWNVLAKYDYTFGTIKGSSSTSFVVNPEPIATVLFIIGGLPIAANIYQRRKKQGKKILI